MDRIGRREFVRKHRTCVFGYNRKNDGPAMTVVYYVLDGDDLLISTMAARAKALAVQRNPKVSLCILDEQFQAQRGGEAREPGHLPGRQPELALVTDRAASAGVSRSSTAAPGAYRPASGGWRREC